MRAADGATVKVDHRSYERQGSEQEPTIKEGVAATAKKRRGEATDRAQQNDDIRERNDDRAQLALEIGADAQELDLLIRRRAEILTAHELRDTITPVKDPSVGLTPRRAQNATALTMEQELTADNDNTLPRPDAPAEPPAAEVRRRQAKDWIAPQPEETVTRDKNTAQPEPPAPKYTQFKGESEAQFASRVARLEARAERDKDKELPKHEMHLRPSGPTFGR